jgi:hypothetical protein
MSNNTSSVDTEPTFEPKAALKNASLLGLQGAGVGAFVSALQNALSKHSAGASGFFTRTGGTIGFFGALGATFALADAVAANQREKHDPINGAIGGCAAGFLVGVRRGSIPVALGSCAFMGATAGIYDYSRGLQGKDDHIDKPQSKEEKRKSFFKEPPAPILPGRQPEPSTQS